MKLNRINNSHILGIEYLENNILGIKFASGRTNYYKNVSKAEATAFIESKNKTDYFMKNIWKKYSICG